jgi:hypothetical protein
MSKKSSVEATIAALMASIYSSISKSAENEWVTRLKKINHLDFRIAARRGRQQPLRWSRWQQLKKAYYYLT